MAIGFFSLCVRNSLGPSISQLPLWRADVSNLTDLMGFCQVSSSRINSLEETLPTAFLNSAQILVKYFPE